MPGRLGKANAPLSVGEMIAGEIVRFQEQEHPAAALIADRIALAISIGTRKQESACSASRGHNHPALACRERRILAQSEAELYRIRADGLFVVVDGGASGSTGVT